MNTAIQEFQVLMAYIHPFVILEIINGTNNVFDMVDFSGMLGAPNVYQNN